MKTVISRYTLLSLVLALCACGKETTPVSGSPSSPGRAAAPAAASRPDQPSAAILTASDLDKVTKAAKPYRLALVVKTRNNPFFDPMIKAFESECNDLGVTGQTYAPPQETDKEIQANTVQTIAAQGADAILIAPADSKGIVPALKQAASKGILVINLDNRVDKTAAAQGLELGGYVGADNEAGGRLAGEEMAKALGGKGKVAIIEGIRGADNAEARRRGFEAGAKGLDVVARESADWKMEEANAKASGVLAANPDLRGIFCANDMMALGALKSIQQAGKSGKVVLIGYDNIPAVQPALAGGGMEATIEQHPDLMGKYGVRMAVGILQGAIPKGREFLVPLDVRGQGRAVVAH